MSPIYGKLTTLAPGFRTVFDLCTDNALQIRA
eukprot:COSAG01_NODE_60405_length_295_cov_0.607143_1_plen_31_part_01